MSTVRLSESFSCLKGLSNWKQLDPPLILQVQVGFGVTIDLVTTPPLLFTFDLGACQNITTF